MTDDKLYFLIFHFFKCFSSLFKKLFAFFFCAYFFPFFFFEKKEPQSGAHLRIYAQSAFVEKKEAHSFGKKKARKKRSAPQSGREEKLHFSKTCMLLLRKKIEQLL
jgi:hypothetical protein